MKNISIEEENSRSDLMILSIIIKIKESKRSEIIIYIIINFRAFRKVFIN